MDFNEEKCVIFVIENKCNSRCSFCSIGGADGALTDLLPIPLHFFKKFLKIFSKKQYSGIILSGGEATLNNELPKYASYARKKGFSHIMIQTNGRALSDVRLVKRLKKSGVNQIWLSFHSINKNISHQMSGANGSYMQTLKGLENLEKEGLDVLTSTVMTSMNYKELPEIERFLKRFRNIFEMQFAGYIPMSSKASKLMLPYAEAAPYLNEAIGAVLKSGRNVCVKTFPVCLLEHSYKKYHGVFSSYILGVKKSFDERGGQCDFKRCLSCQWPDCRGLPAVYRRKASLGIWMPSAMDRVRI